jgi:hypothetical protein
VAPPEQTIFAGWGTGQSFSPDIRTGPGGQGAQVEQTREKIFLTPTQFLTAFDKFSREDFLKFRNLFIAAGLASPESDPMSVRSTYAALLNQMVDMAAAGRTISPMGYVKNLIVMNGIDPASVGSDENYGVDPASQPFSGVKRTVQRSVTEISEGEAWATLQNNLSNLLGRDPSDQETRDFVYRMNALAASNPAVSKTATRYKNGEAVSSSTHTDPGFTGADMAQEAYTGAQNNPDYAEYRSASYLFNAVLSALGPIGG